MINGSDCLVRILSRDEALQFTLSSGGRQMQVPDCTVGVCTIQGDFGDAHAPSSWTSRFEM